MLATIVVSPDIPATHDLRGFGLDAFFADSGEIAARSRSSETVAFLLAGADLHVKRYRYSPKQAFRGCLRNTFREPSRVRAEYEILRRIASKVGDVAAVAVAYGEQRHLGFLRRAFLATATIAGAVPVGPDVSVETVGNFLRRIHDGGLSHGRLYPRNLLVSPDGSLRMVDLDRARLTVEPVTGPRAATDLVYLLSSMEGIDGDAVHAAYGRPVAERDMKRARGQAAAGREKRAGPPHVTG